MLRRPSEDAMFDRFTDRSRKIMSLSRQAALRLGHEYIGTEHILLGLLELEGSTTDAILKNSGADREALRASFESGLETGPNLGVGASAVGQVPFSPRAKHVLERTMEEASGLAHNYIGSEHLLLGLLSVQGTSAAAFLEASGLSLEAMREAVTEFVGTDRPSLPQDTLRHVALAAMRDRIAASQGPSGEQRLNQRLLLISNSTMHGGGYLSHCSAEIRDFLGEGSKRVAFVPYALADHDGYEQKAKKAFTALGHDLRSVHHADDPCSALEGVDAVFVGGGNTFRLLDTLYRTGLVHAIRLRVWSGMAYIGSSAGTNVATLSIKTTNDMPISMPPSFDALQLVPFQINPHYLDPDPDSKHMGETREERLMQFHEENDTPVLAIREGCMLRVEGDSMELRGTTGARLFRRGQEREEFTPPCDLTFLLKTST